MYESVYVRINATHWLYLCMFERVYFSLVWVFIQTVKHFVILESAIQLKLILLLLLLLLW